jgi:hypothetical protein
MLSTRVECWTCLAGPGPRSWPFGDTPRKDAYARTRLLSLQRADVLLDKAASCRVSCGTPLHTWLPAYTSALWKARLQQCTKALKMLQPLAVFGTVPTSLQLAATCGRTARLLKQKTCRPAGLRCKVPATVMARTQMRYLWQWQMLWQLSRRHN